METAKLPPLVSALNKKLASYMRAGNTTTARDLFAKMLPNADIVSWNTILACCRRGGDTAAVFCYFLRLRRSELKPTAQTFVITVSAAADVCSAAPLVPQLHAAALLFSSNPFVSTALVSGYVRGGDLSSACRMFDEMPERTSLSWTLLTSGMMDAGHTSYACKLFDEMPEKTVPAWTAMVAGRARNGEMDEARRLFDAMPKKNVVSWTALIKGYLRASKFAAAFNVFVEMRSSRDTPSPNEFTFSTALGACAGMVSLVAGAAVHADFIKSGVQHDSILASSLVDMYSKCGDFEAALKVFEERGNGKLECWNTVMACCARHGLAARAMFEFERMRAAGVAPDAVTFVSLLAACARAGMVEEGRRVLEEMERVFGVEVGREHWGCVVDMLGRGGDMEGAIRVAEMMEGTDEMVAGALAWAGAERGRVVEEVERMGFGRLPAMVVARKRVSGERGEWGVVAEIKEWLPHRSLQRAASWISS